MEKYKLHIIHKQWGLIKYANISSNISSHHLLLIVIDREGIHYIESQEDIDVDIISMKYSDLDDFLLENRNRYDSVPYHTYSFHSTSNEKSKKINELTDRMLDKINLAKHGNLILTDQVSTIPKIVQISTLMTNRNEHITTALSVDGSIWESVDGGKWYKRTLEIGDS
jgi:hypothetical protein